MADAADTPQAEPQVEAAPTPAAPSAEEYAALQQKLRSYDGRDRAFQETQKRLAEVERDKEAAMARLAEIEQANMSELEKAQRERDKFKERVAEVEREKERIRLEARYPLAAAILDGDILPEEKMAKLNEELTRKAAIAAPAPEEPERAPSNPPKARPDTTSGMSRLERAKALLSEAAQSEVQKWSLPD